MPSPCPPRDVLLAAVTKTLAEHGSIKIVDPPSANSSYVLVGHLEPHPNHEKYGGGCEWFPVHYHGIWVMVPAWMAP